MSASEWTDFAGKIEEAGADALELNVYILPISGEKRGSEYERIYFDLAEKIKSIIHIPLVFKLGRQFTNLNYVVTQLSYRQVDGIVLFNRFYEPDIDIQKLKLTSAPVFSNSAEIRQTLRWIGLLSGASNHPDLAASTGVHDAAAVAKLLLAGASVTQVCSVLYEKGIAYLDTLNRELSAWMDDHEFHNIENFRGTLNYRNLENPSMYERSQFMKFFSDYH